MSIKPDYAKMTLEERVNTIISYIDEAFPYGIENHRDFHVKVDEEKKAEEKKAEEKVKEKGEKGKKTKKKNERKRMNEEKMEEKSYMSIESLENEQKSSNTHESEDEKYERNNRKR